MSSKTILVEHIASIATDLDTATSRVHKFAVLAWATSQKRTALYMSRSGMIYAVKVGSEEHKAVEKTRGMELFATVDPSIQYPQPAEYSRSWLKAELHQMGLTKPRMVG